MTTSPQMVRVTWEDACCLDPGVSWVPTEEGHKHNYEPIIVTTVGFLIHQSDDGLIIAGAWSPDRIGPRDQIPRGMIKLVEFLEPAKTRRKPKG